MTTTQQLKRQMKEQNFINYDNCARCRSLKKVDDKFYCGYSAIQFEIKHQFLSTCNMQQRIKR